MVPSPRELPAKNVDDPEAMDPRVVELSVEEEEGYLSWRVDGRLKASRFLFQPKSPRSRTRPSPPPSFHAVTKQPFHFKAYSDRLLAPVFYVKEQERTRERERERERDEQVELRFFSPLRTLSFRLGPSIGGSREEKQPKEGRAFPLEVDQPR